MVLPKWNLGRLQERKENEVLVCAERDVLKAELCVFGDFYGVSCSPCFRDLRYTVLLFTALSVILMLL